MAIGRVKKHGHHTRLSGRSKEYVAWDHMKRRCNNPKEKNYSNYGGRGIMVCERWNSFENFLKDMGLAPSHKHSIDRFPNNDGHYQPENCRWATKKEQENNKRTNKVLVIDGISKTVTQWSEIYKVNKSTLFYRIQRGITDIAELTKRARKKQNPKNRTKERTL